MAKRILVPSGIGDFSWTWSKLVTTKDEYHIEYVGGLPDRMTAFLSLLPKDRIVGFNSNPHYATKWNEQGELIIFSRQPTMFPEVPTARRYSDIRENQLIYVESNTFLERGNRLEDWWKEEIPGTDFHYKIDGVLGKYTSAPYFIVNFSSYGTKKAWGYYEVPVAADLVEFIVKKTGWIPFFIGGYYDDFTSDIHNDLVNRGVKALSLVGKTPKLIEVITLLQQSKMYYGACSGLMAVANVLRIPVAVYYPPFNRPPGRFLAGTWHDTNVPYLSLFWEGKEGDICQLEKFMKLC